jgi:hypothetical protein
MNAPVRLPHAVAPVIELDPRLTCLSLVSANCFLFEAGERSLDDAFTTLVDAVEAVIGPCTCSLIPDTPPPRAPAPPKPRPTPQASIDAVKYSIRQRGVKAVQEPANRQRIATFDAAAREQINQFIARLENAATG